MHNSDLKLLIAQYEQLTIEEQRKIATALERHFGREIRFDEPELAKLEAPDLAVIRSMIQGWLMTKQYVPNVKDAYEALKGTELPRKVSFGRRIRGESDAESSGD
ncbi:hypothetical protein [Paenibacillus xanthanilyticus]|uniref:Uncharacterized protein n=1 Tax=Paenibacillus xanthanilyticus TaxID=1783531 RepID=A0ABV8JZI3_9BACL